MEKKRLQAMMFLVVLLTALYVTQTSAAPPLGKRECELIANSYRRVGTILKFKIGAYRGSGNGVANCDHSRKDLPNFATEAVSD